jgi:hypothetical protein
MHASKIFRATLVILLGLALNSCGGGSSSNNPPPQGVKFGSVFVLGTDAPITMPSVVAFKVTLTGLSISDGTNTHSLLSQPQEMEFSRLDGLRTLLSLQSIPVGTYTSFTATLSTPEVYYLDTSTTPPSVQTLNGTLTLSSVTVQLYTPLAVVENDLIGLLLDFRLRDSLLVNGSGQLTGQVNPALVLRVIPPDAPEAVIDELRGGVVSVDIPNGSFVMQGPLGRLYTVVTDAQTYFEEGEGLNTLTTNSIVQVSGSLQRQTLKLKATEVVVVSDDRFVVGGLVTDVRPATGPANEMDVLVRSELPDLANVQIGGISTFGFDGNERFLIHAMRFPFAPLLFNRGSLIEGQRVSVGGLQTGGTLDVRRVVLHRQGLVGGWIVGSTRIDSGNNGRFRFNVTGIVGVLFERPVTVFTCDRTRFINLPGGLADLTGTAPIPLRVVGLVLNDHINNEQVIIAMAVEKL